MIALEPDTRRRLIASARLLTSDKEGERIAALEAVQRLLPVPLADMLERSISTVLPFRPQPIALLRRWQKTAQFLAAFPDLLNDKERAFVRDMQARRDEPTPKQRDWLDSLSARIEARRAA
jgi:hypothetical protein